MRDTASPKQNGFRAEIGAGDEFTVIYSGGLGHNVALDPLLEAAARLRSEPFRFVIAGEGAQKQALVQRARYAAAHPEIMREMGERPALPLAYRAKLALEWLAALLALIVLSPLLALLALAVALDSPGPVLFQQPRLGRGGRVFTMYKFRTLRWAPREAPRLAADGSTMVEANDDRLTRTGRWLRGGLDELPQLWNVLRGEMTLIGPRPDEPFHAPLYTAEERRKLLVPPGITGLPQIAGRADIPWKERIRMDLEYIDHYSPARDVWIAARTLLLVLRPSGAGRAA